MSNIQDSSNNNNQYQITQYKTTYSCDGRNCSNTANYELKIWYLKPHVYFCTSCKEDLEENGMVESIVSSHKGIRASKVS